MEETQDDTKGHIICYFPVRKKRKSPNVALGNENIIALSKESVGFLIRARWMEIWGEVFRLLCILSGKDDQGHSEMQSILKVLSISNLCINAL